MTPCVNFVASPEGQELAVLCLKYGYRLSDRIQDLTRNQIEFLLTAAEHYDNFKGEGLEIGD